MVQLIYKICMLESGGHINMLEHEIMSWIKLLVKLVREEKKLKA